MIKKQKENCSIVIEFLLLVITLIRIRHITIILVMLLLSYAN